MKLLRDHPVIDRMERTGYPVPVADVEHCGVDVFGDEILEGDNYVEADGELILADNLQRYLEEYYQFKFKMAE